MINKNVFVKTNGLLQAFHHARDSFLGFASRTNFLAGREVELTLDWQVVRLSEVWLQLSCLQDFPIRPSVRDDYSAMQRWFSQPDGK